MGDVLTMNFCILFIFSLNSNQLKLLSILWIIGMDCIRCKDKLFLGYSLFLAIIDLIFELYQQLMHTQYISNYLIDIDGKNVHLHSLEVACIVVIIIRLILPFYKLRPSHYSMSKKLLFVRKNRYRRDLLRFVHKKSTETFKEEEEIKNDKEEESVDWNLMNEDVDIRRNRFSTTDQVPAASLYYLKKKNYKIDNESPLIQPLTFDNDTVYN